MTPYGLIRLSRSQLSRWNLFVTSGRRSLLSPFLQTWSLQAGNVRVYLYLYSTPSVSLQSPSDVISFHINVAGWNGAGRLTALSSYVKRY